MDESKVGEKRPDPRRVKALQNLPRDATASLTKEEVSAFLFDEVWPDSLRRKLKDYLVEQD